MATATKQDRIKIEEVREKKDKTVKKVKRILEEIRKDDLDIFRKVPEDRVKKLEKIIKKIKSKLKCNIDNFERYIRDIAGARITCCTLDEIPKVIDLIKNHVEISNCKILRKYEKHDDDGYRGCHLEVTVEIVYKKKIIKDICEIQVRTLAGDLWAVLSHRDFYKAPSEPPPLVRKDMLTLSKLLEVVDESALSLRQRIKDETDKKVKAKAKLKKLANKDMLTPENIQKLVRKVFQKEISIDFAYKLVQSVLALNIVSLNEYKTLVEKHQDIIRNTFKKFSVTPQLVDSLYAPMFLESEGIKDGKEALVERAQDLRKKTLRAVEKGREIPKEELEEKLEKKIEISQPM